MPFAVSAGAPFAVLVFAALVWLLRRRRAAWAALAIALALWVSGCAAVKPWQREQLSKSPMLFVSDGLELKLEEHVFQYREGSAGGFGFGGGGCGCN